jgi:hypothetical protein
MPAQPRCPRPHILEAPAPSGAPFAIDRRGGKSAPIIADVKAELVIMCSYHDRGGRTIGVTSYVVDGLL